VPGKDDAPAPPRRPREVPRYRRPPDEEVQRAARRLVRGGKASFASQEEFLRALTLYLRREEPLAAVGGRRLRRLLVGLPGVRLSVHYAERDDPRPFERCPVCGSELRPIRNRTLSGESIVLGQRCARCDFWSHRARRVPVRYRITSVRASSVRSAG